MLDDMQNLNAPVLKESSPEAHPREKSGETKLQSLGCELLYHQLWHKAKEIYGWALAYSKHNTGSIDTLKGLIQNLERDPIWTKITDSLKNGDELIFNVFMPSPKYDILVNHPVNVSILSLKLGLAIKDFSEKELKRLGLAALVHDLGMGGILTSIMNKADNLSESEVRAIEKHPAVGKSYISQLGRDYEWLAELCYQEHERENGQGYPRGLSQDQIHPMAKIIGLMDTVDAMIHPRPWKKSLPPPDVIQTLLTTQKEYFSSELVKALIREVSPFPPGSFVRLNSKEIAQVFRVNKRYPLRPDIIVYYDSNGIPLSEPKIIQLETHPILHIGGSMEMHNIPCLNFNIKGN